MGIKRPKSIVIISFILVSVISIYNISNIAYSQTYNNENEDIIFSSIEEVLVDKVYNFTLINPYVNFSNNIYFEKPFFYYISFQIVSPHTYHMNISLRDPENDKYDIYDSRGRFPLVPLIQFEKPEIPFGVAITGNYSITFQAHLTENLNIHIKIMKSQNICLQDTIKPSEFGRRVLCQVKKFYNKSVILHNITLKKDWLYRFYFGRYSPIANESVCITKVDFDIISSVDIEYKIYLNKTLRGVCEVSFFDFGTAVEFTYNIIMTIYTKVKCVNIAYNIVDIDKIAVGLDPNDPYPPPDNGHPVNNTRTGIEVFIPAEWIIGMVIFLGFVVGLPILMGVYRKNKNLTVI
ncbi:MAG: hypothetical protein ACFE75_07125 [Candidatus Hodarchaeota archaeon]